MNLVLQWFVAMYASNEWHSMISENNTEHDNAYFRTKAVIVFDRLMAGRLP